MTTWLVLLLVVSALCELYGTTTVALSYWRGHKLATGVLVALDASELPDVQRLLALTDPTMANMGVEETRSYVRKLAGHALRRRYLTAGLIAYVVGALAGLAAGLIAIAR